MSRSILIVLLVHFNFLGLAQQSEVQGLINTAEFSTLYRGYNNHLELLTCEGCDSVFVSSANAVITMRDKVQFYVKPNQGTREVTLSVNCIKANDTTTLWNEKFRVRPLPPPTIYYGANDLSKDLNHLDEVSFYAQKFISARYDEHIHLTNIVFHIKEWSVSVGKNELKYFNKIVSNHFKAAFYYAKRNTAIRFNYCIVVGPDGQEQRIESNQTYFKKTKKKEEIPAADKPINWKSPTGG